MSKECCLCFQIETLNTCETPNNSYSSPVALKTNPSGKRIDYICFKGKGGVAVKTVSSDVPWPHRVPDELFSYSDHEAVVAKLRITKSLGKSVIISCFTANKLTCKELVGIIQWGFFIVCIVTDAVPVQGDALLDAKKEVILESIEICSAALEHLRFNKKMYFVISLVCLCFLLALGSFDVTSNWWIILPIVRVFTLLILVFGVIMGMY